MSTEDTNENVIVEPKPRSIWTDDARWEKLKIAKDEVGTWSRLTDVVIEQLLASGLVSNEGRDKIQAVNIEHGIEVVDDSAWREVFKIREPWPLAATHLRGIHENLGKIQEGLGNLAQVVEDHATTMLEAELVKTETEELS